MNSTLLIFIIFLTNVSKFACKYTNYSNKLGVINISNNGFGPFYATTEKFEKCQHFKRTVDESHFTPMTIGVLKVNRTKEMFTGYIYIPLNVQYHEVLVQISYWKDSGFRQIYSGTVKHPCSDVLVTAVLKSLHPDKSCTVKKGNYTFSLKTDLNELVHLLIGEKFFYARLLIRSEIYTKNGTIYCVKAYCQTKSIKKSTLIKNH